MFGIDTSSATPNCPIPAATGTPGYFTSASPAEGRAATEVSADFLNAVGDELTNVVKAAGLTPSKTDREQVKKAIGILMRHVVIRIWLADRKPRASEIISIPMITGDKLLAGLAGSYAYFDAAPTSVWVATLTKDGVSVGTLTFMAGIKTGSFALVSDVLYSTAGVFEITCPATQDASAKNLSILIAGQINQEA
jgi:hypothetical protein